MNSKTSAVFLCALLCSTFGHDLLNAQLNIAENIQVTNVQEVQKSTNDDVITSYTDKEVASLVSKDPVYYCSNSDGSVIGVTNCDKDKALIIDLQEGIVLIANGRNGAGVIIELETNVAKQITSGLWLSSTTSIESFISSVNSKTLNGNTTLDVSSPPQEVRTLVQSVLSSIDISLALKLEVDNISGLSLAINYSANIRDDLANKVNVTLFTLVSTNLVEVKGGLTALKAICNTIVALQAELEVNTILEAGATVSLVSILSAKSGLDVFVDICVTFSTAGLDLSKVISSSVWSNGLLLVSLGKGLGGELNVGVNGIGEVNARILDFINDTTKLDALLLKIIKVVDNINAPIDLKTPHLAFLSILEQQISKYNSSAVLSGTIDLLSNIIDNSYIESDVNISAIDTLLCGGLKSTTRLELVVKVCDLLTTNVTLEVSTELVYTTLYRVLLELLDDLAGRSLLRILIPGILDNVNTVVSCLNILENTNLSDVLDVLKNDGVVSALMTINITGNMYESCRKAIESTSSIDLDDCIVDCSAVDESDKIEIILQNADNLGC